MGAPADYTGQKFNRLTAVRYLRSVNNKRVWLFKCDCGASVEAVGYRVASSKTPKPRSCGCWHQDAVTTHGRSKTRIYRIWVGIKARCHNPCDTQFKHYGAKGITVCERWRYSFDKFYEDMSETYEDFLELDRINPKKGYSLANCRWVTHTENMRNNRSFRKIEWAGELLTVREAAAKLDMKYSTLSNRLTRGWSVTRALTQPVDKRTYDL